MEGAVRNDDHDCVLALSFHRWTCAVHTSRARPVLGEGGAASIVSGTLDWLFCPSPPTCPPVLSLLTPGLKMEHKESRGEGRWPLLPPSCAVG